MLPALTIALLAAPPAVWLDSPVPLDRNLETSDLDRIAGALKKAIADNVRGDVVYGRDVILRPPAPGEEGTGLQRARTLLSEGKESYLGFEFAPAAAALAEAAALLTNELAHLTAGDVERLYEARLLEGVAWVEAGQKAAAKAAFRKLITIRPDFEPDPVRVPPNARQVFRKSLGELRVQGLASIQVRSEPSGATVYLDGLKRGITPLTVAGLPAGSHGLRLTLDGYQALTRAITLEPKQEATSDSQLEPSALLAAYERIRAAARAGRSHATVEADLSHLSEEIGCSSIILMGAAQRTTDLVVTFRRWDSAGNHSAVVAIVDHANMQQVVSTVTPMLLRDTWPAVQLPSAPVMFDFSRGLLGIGPDWGGEPAKEDSVLATWWFWTGVAVLVGGAATAGVLLATRDKDPAPPDSVNFTLVFP